MYWVDELLNLGLFLQQAHQRPVSKTIKTIAELVTTKIIPTTNGFAEVTVSFIVEGDDGGRGRPSPQTFT